jgi:flagellar basal-body rod modification protein FlgD
MASIGVVGGATAANLETSGIGMQDFMKIMLTQLTFQDPLKPMDTQEFMAQMAQFTSLEQMQQLNDKMSALLTTQASLQSVGLIGRAVDISTDAGTITGQVSALSLAGDTPLINVTTASGTVLQGVSLSQVQAVR